MSRRRLGPAVLAAELGQGGHAGRHSREPNRGHQEGIVAVAPNPIRPAIRNDRVSGQGARCRTGRSTAHTTTDLWRRRVAPDYPMVTLLPEGGDQLGGVAVAQSPVQIMCRLAAVRDLDRIMGSRRLKERVEFRVQPDVADGGSEIVQDGTPLDSFRVHFGSFRRLWITLHEP